MASLASGAARGKQAVRWWEKVEETPTVWQALLTDDGLEYYVNTENGTTTWDKPEELMTPDEINSQGTWVWAPHQTNVYVPAKLVSTRGKKQRSSTRTGPSTP